MGFLLIYASIPPVYQRYISLLPAYSLYMQCGGCNVGAIAQARDLCTSITTAENIQVWFNRIWNFIHANAIPISLDLHSYTSLQFAAFELYSDRLSTWTNRYTLGVYWLSIEEHTAWSLFITAVIALPRLLRLHMEGHPVFVVAGLVMSTLIWWKIHPVSAKK